MSLEQRDKELAAIGAVRTADAVTSALAECVGAPVVAEAAT
jgi:hypothetical protein